MAEYDRKKVLRRLRIGKIGKVKAGKVLLGEHAPYGYRRSADGNLVICEEEAAVVRLIFRWYLDGMLVRTIARKLAEASYHKPRFHGERQRFEEWSHATVRRILSSEVYVGVWHYNKTRWVKVKDPESGRQVARNVPRPREEWIAVSVPAIIDPETFAATRAQAAYNEQYNPRNRRHDYVFSQMLRSIRSQNPFTVALFYHTVLTLT